MPLVTISLSEARSIEDQKLIADGIHEAIVGGRISTSRQVTKDS
jgi:hypothetical protein